MLHFPDVQRIAALTRGGGGMADAADLKSVGLITRVGSTPTRPTARLFESLVFVSGATHAADFSS